MSSPTLAILPVEADRAARLPEVVCDLLVGHPLLHKCVHFGTPLGYTPARESAYVKVGIQRASANAVLLGNGTHAHHLQIFPYIVRLVTKQVPCPQLVRGAVAVDRGVRLQQSCSRSGSPANGGGRASPQVA